MYSFFGGGNTVDYNTVVPSPEAISTICTYPMAKTRSDMGYQEYNRYKNNWSYFNHVWSYNYTVSTLRSTTSNTSIHYYAFPTNAAIHAYSNGQAAHAAYYTSNTAVFKNISNN